jgi:choline dehydrogenase-like flavoprotein
MQAFDYIIVGAGSAGCVLANRLSADPSTRVLLIESGGEDNNPFIRVPMGIGKTLADPSLTMYYMTEPEAGNAFRPRVWMRGKSLGGSSTINGMMYMRGQPEDYDDWGALGNTGWNWQEIGRCFREMEDHVLGDDGVRGAGGPLHISIQSHQSPLTEAILQAGVKMGLERREDLNRPRQEGIAYTPVTIKNGRRVSASDAFLKPIRHRANLTVAINTHVNKLLFDGMRVTGVEARQGDSTVQFQARSDVILSAGAIETPKLLQISGIGPGALLQKLGVPVVVENAAVGGNMREHKVLTLTAHLTGPYSHNVALRGPRLYWNTLKYLMFRSGSLASTYDITAFVRTDPTLNRPDAQITFWSLTADKTAQSFQLEKDPGMLIMGYPLRTRSEGSIQARSTDPTAPPVIATNFLDHEYDRKVIIGMFRYMRRFVDQAPLKGLLARETWPGPDVQTDEQVIEAARQDDTCVHAVGTCKMGIDPASVVDPQLRVRGVTGLRVVDCSVMPTQVSGNTNGPVMALAWRAAEVIQASKNPA